MLYFGSALKKLKIHGHNSRMDPVPEGLKLILTLLMT